MVEDANEREQPTQKMVIADEGDDLLSPLSLGSHAANLMDSKLLDDDLLDDNLIADSPLLLHVGDHDTSTSAKLLEQESESFDAVNPAEMSPVKDESPILPSAHKFRNNCVIDPIEPFIPFNLHKVEQIADEETKQDDLIANGSQEEEVLLLEEDTGEVIQADDGANLQNNVDQTNANEESKKDAPNNPESTGLDQIPSVDLGWSDFEKICKLGEGANGTVFKVKALTNTIFSQEHDGRIELNNPELMKKYGAASKQKLGINMQSAVEKSNKTRQLVKDQAYVIKEIDVSVLPEKAAFEAMQEIQIMAEVDSHFVVGYYDSFITEQTICIIMQYCEHGDLSSAIKKQNGKAFANNFLWKVFIHICLGMHYLHARNVVHRDIKSLNVFLTKDNSAKLGDFGNIKRVKDESENALVVQGTGGQVLEQIGEEVETEAGQEDEEEQRVGTPYYLAPELWLNKPQSKASDIWALGVVLYEMCAHKYPYDANDIDELQEKVQKERYNPIPQGVTKDFNMIIKQCLQRKQDNRATIDEIIFSEDFQKKAKINKITLPKHLNKQKLLQSIQTKKPLEAEERKLILELTKRGVLPKHLEQEVMMIEAQMMEEQQYQSNLVKHKSSDTPSAAGDQAHDLSLNLSPTNPKLLRHAQSNNINKPGNGLVNQSQHIKHQSQDVSSNGLIRDNCQSQRELIRPSNVYKSQHVQPEINVQRPKLNSLIVNSPSHSLLNNPMVQSAKEQQASRMQKMSANQTPTNQSNTTTTGRKFTAPSETKTSRLRAAQQRNNAAASNQSSVKDGGAVTKKFNESRQSQKTDRPSLMTFHQQSETKASNTEVLDAEQQDKIICATEPHEQTDDLAVFDLPDDDENDELLTVNLTPSNAALAAANGGRKRSSTFRFSGKDPGKSTASIPQPNSTVSKFAPSSISGRVSKSGISTGGIGKGTIGGEPQRKQFGATQPVSAFQVKKSTPAYNSSRLGQGLTTNKQNNNQEETKSSQKSSARLQLQSKRQSDQDANRGQEELKQRPTQAGLAAQQGGGAQATTAGGGGTAERRRMLKSPSAKELGRYRMQPIATNTSNIKKPEETKQRIFGANSKIGTSQRSSLKVPNRQSLASARPTTTTNASNTNQATLAAKRTKFTPSGTLRPMNGKPPTTKDKVAGSTVHARRLTVNDSDQLRFKGGRTNATGAAKTAGNSKDKTQRPRSINGKDKATTGARANVATTAATRGTKIEAANRFGVRRSIGGGTSGQLARAGATAAATKKQTLTPKITVENQENSLEEVKEDVQDVVVGAQGKSGGIIQISNFDLNSQGHSDLLDIDEEADLTRPHRYAYDSFITPASTSLHATSQPNQMTSTFVDVDGGNTALANTQYVRNGFASFVANHQVEATDETPEELQIINDSDSIQFDFNNDLTEVEQAKLKKSIDDDEDQKQKTDAEADEADGSMPIRTQSHFVQLNANNEDMLFDEIDDDTEKSLNKMLLDNEKDGEDVDLERDEDELLI